MLEKNIYYDSLKSKEISNRENITEVHDEISATKTEVKRLQRYINRCKEFEEEESRSMLNPFTFTEDRAAHREYNENLNTVLNMIYDLGTEETRDSIATI